ncbi:MAG: hypothetical protein U0800_01970 [Isosphaeraceae bacterium]
MAIPNPAAEPSAERLEQLREILLRALDELETRARRRLQESARPVDDEEVERRLKELEAAQAQFRSEVERWENARAGQLQALDQDRLDLAEVWRQIERQEVREPARAQAQAYPRPHGNGPGSSLPPMPRPASSNTSAESSVTRAILEQFRVLRRDVRRKADGRASG